MTYICTPSLRSLSRASRGSWLSFQLASVATSTNCSASDLAARPVIKINSSSRVQHLYSMHVLKYVWKRKYTFFQSLGIQLLDNIYFCKLIFKRFFRKENHITPIFGHTFKRLIDTLSEKNYETLCFCKVTELSCIYKGIQ